MPKRPTQAEIEERGATGEIPDVSIVSLEPSQEISQPEEEDTAIRTPRVLTDSEMDRTKLAAIEHGLKSDFVEGEQAGMSLQDRMAHYHVPDVSIAIIDGETITPTAYHLFTSSEPAATQETLFQAGSISKFVNAVIALKLVEEGKLDLDQDVNTRLKVWKLPENEYTTSEKVTLRRLLSHTAGVNIGGFPGYDSPTAASNLPTNEAILSGGAYLSQSQQEPFPEEIHEQHLEHQYFFVQDKGESKLFYVNVDEQCSEVEVKFPDKLVTSIQGLLADQASSTHPKIALSSEQIKALIDKGECSPPELGTATHPGIQPIQTPGSAFRYSGGGAQIVQQLIVEAVGGEKSYAEIAKGMVFDPLGMTSSTFAIKQPEEARTFPITSGHRGDGLVVEGDWHLYPESAAAGLWTTPTDLAKFVIGIQNHHILTEQTTAAMLTPDPNSQYKPGRFLGLGPFLNPAANEFSHTAGTLGFSASCIGFSEGINKGAIVMTNSSNGGALLQELNRSIASSYEWPKEFSGNAIALTKPDPSILSAVKGDYEYLTPMGSVTLTISQKEDRFFISGPFPTLENPGIECELKQGSDTTFYFRPDHDDIDRHDRITLIGDPPDRFEINGQPVKPRVANAAAHDVPCSASTSNLPEELAEKNSEPAIMEPSAEQLLAARQTTQQFRARIKHNETAPFSVDSDEEQIDDDSSATP